MASRNPQRIMMLSTHGYVAAQPELGKPDTGGQVVYVLELSKCLARLGFQVDIYTRQFEGQPAQEPVAPRVNLVRIACGGHDFIPKETLYEAIPEWVTNARSHIRQQRLRYQFINSHYWDAGLAGQALANQLSIPHLHTPHSIGSWKRDNMNGPREEAERRWNLARRIREEKVVYDECDGLIATTTQQREILQGGDYDVPRGKIQVVTPGYDDLRFYPVSIATRQTLKRELGLEGRIILALGRLARNKGYDLLIRSMCPVFARIPDARLLLAIGSTQLNADEQQQLAALQALACELGIADRILFRDYIPDESLADYYRAADVFALSSRYEPFGMTAIEAMACGTPTVITTEGGLWEQVNWGLEAMYANPNDTEAFGHEVCKLLQYPLVYDQLAKHGSQKARARFTWNGVSQQILGACESLQRSSVVPPIPSTVMPAQGAIA
ncbi:MAG TPA: glycosyltransferase [Pirellulaceae bacterium]|nr:glycosyltransferase [Pirellulaceae bacterium]